EGAPAANDDEDEADEPEPVAPGAVPETPASPTSAPPSWSAPPVSSPGVLLLVVPQAAWPHPHSSVPRASLNASAETVTCSTVSTVVRPSTRSSSAYARACSNVSYNPSARYLRANASTAAHARADRSDGNTPAQHCVPASPDQRRNPAEERALRIRSRT